MELIIISDELQQYLQDLKNSSGAGASAMLRGANDRPKGLDTEMVNRWSEMPKWIKITPKIRRELQLEHERTGISAVSLLNIAGSLMAQSSPAQSIIGWLVSVTKRRKNMFTLS